MSTTEPRAGLVDAVLAGGACAALGVGWALQIAVVPTFRMYAEFGTDLAVPLLTGWVTSGALTIATSALTLALVVAGVAWRALRGGGGGVALEGLALAIAVASAIAIVVGLYLPVFAVAGAIAP